MGSICTSWSAVLGPGSRCSRARRLPEIPRASSHQRLGGAPDLSPANPSHTRTLQSALPAMGRLTSIHVLIRESRWYDQTHGSGDRHGRPCLQARRWGRCFPNGTKSGARRWCWENWIERGLSLEQGMANDRQESGGRRRGCRRHQHCQDANNGEHDRSLKPSGM